MYEIIINSVSFVYRQVIDTATCLSERGHHVAEDGPWSRPGNALLLEVAEVQRSVAVDRTKHT